MAEGEITWTVITDLYHSEVIRWITNMCLNQGDDEFANYKTAGMSSQMIPGSAGIFTFLRLIRTLEVKVAWEEGETKKS